MITQFATGSSHGMVPVDDAEVRWAILKYLAGLIDSGHLEPLIEGGLTPDLLDALRNRRMRDITHVAKDTSIGFHVHLDSQRLIRAFANFDAVMRDKELMEYFLRRGAQSHLMTRMFRVSGHEMRLMREMLCGDSFEHGGRPTMPADSKTRDAIHTAWAALNHSADEGLALERERLYALSQEFPGFSIATLWAVITEFGDTLPA